MEEDIKVLEEILNRNIEDTEGTKIMKQAIENLIKGYKELEEKLLLSYKLRDDLYTPKVYIEENYIPKSKVREKIEELEQDIEIHSIYEENWNKIEVLQELLQEGDK